MSKQSDAARDIGEIPPVINMERKQRTRESFRAFCEAYFPERFTDDWGQDRLEAIDTIEQAIVSGGGTFRFFLGRGRGASTLLEVGTMWAQHRHAYILLFGYSGEGGISLLSNIKSEYETNKRLLADWPEICVPIRALEGNRNRTGPQLCCGEPTYIRWDQSAIALPRVANSSVSEHAIRTMSVNGGLRGIAHRQHDAVAVRPSLAIFDSVMPRDVVGKARMNARLAGEFRHLAGPKQQMTLLMANC